MRLAIVTGTSRGIGAALALELLSRGWNVQGVARGEAPAPLRATPAYHHERLDLGELGDVAAFFEGPLRERLGEQPLERLGLVNNAAVLEPVGPIARLAAPDLARAVLVNVAAPIWLAGFALRLVRSAPLRVVNVSSGAAQHPYPGWAAYCATKAALAMADRVLAQELGEVSELAGRDVAVVSYAPGVVDTEMQRSVREGDEELFPRRARFVQLFESGELVAPEHPAREIAHLLEADDLPRHSERRFGEGAG